MASVGVMLLSGVPSGAMAATSETVDYDLSPLVVTGTAVPKRPLDLVQPVSVLGSESLQALAPGTIGDAVNGLPGVHASAVGSGASRPVIRGFEGPRIRLLEGGLDNFDVSSTSPDHGVAFDPFFAEAVEVLRGPATLLYGSAAIGGVVNIMDRRVVRQRESDSFLSAQALWESAASKKAGGVLAGHGEEAWGIRAGVYWRDAAEYRLPSGGQERVLEQSQARSDSQSLSVALFPGPKTRLSLSGMYLSSDYGVPGHEHGHEEEHEEEHAADEHEEHEAHEEGEHEAHEEAVSIGLEQRLWSAEMEHSLGSGPFRTLNFAYRWADYAHQEWEGAIPATRFGRDGREARLEALHWLPGEHPGVIGVHFLESDLTTLGEESNTPDSTVRQRALFVLQEVTAAATRWEIGGRVEDGRIDPASGEAYRGEAVSVSVGLNRSLSERLRFSLALSRSQRHPTSVELFADGAHAASRLFEVGDADLGVETATGMDATLRIEGDTLSGGLTAFLTTFEDYIYADFTGEERSGFPEVRYSAVDARFVGMEWEGLWHLLHAETESLHVRLTGDWVRASVRGTGRPLPRIPPARFGGGLHYQIGDHAIDVSGKVALAQDRTAPNETRTSGYIDLALSFSTRLTLLGVRGRIHVTATNILDETIRYHTSTLKDEAPMPGRGVRLLWRADF